VNKCAFNFDSDAKACFEKLRKAVFAEVQAVDGRASTNLAKLQEKSGTRFESLESGITHFRGETTENSARLTTSLAEACTPMKEVE
jgi:hypothetical protein